MTPEHPMNLPEKLKGELWKLYWKESINSVRKAWENSVAKAYRAGADRRLEAVCEYIAEEGKWFATPQFRLAELRAAMDPKPTSLAEQGLAALERRAALSVPSLAATNDCEAIRCALERLQQLEQENNGH